MNENIQLGFANMVFMLSPEDSQNTYLAFIKIFPKG